jgi:antitoxin VapB
VYVRKVGDSLIVSPKRPSWDEFFSTPSAFGDDFLIERDNTLPQEREWF